MTFLLGILDKMGFGEKLLDESSAVFTKRNFQCLNGTLSSFFFFEL